jgi:hypothetical protein
MFLVFSRSYVFNNQPNDGVVTVTSQFDGLSSNFLFSGIAHSGGVLYPTGLGFAPPDALYPDSATSIPSTVIKLLNTSVANSVFRFLNP